MNLEAFQHCVCLRMGNRLSLCDGEHQFSENGVKVRHTTRPGEKVTATTPVPDIRSYI
ncbi:hypothetical protein [Thiomicrospira microaerophila]|uniref:hypothetical protein n=1 Tax=Thiomicrospira microaerophila TaxID=406020 RepID=UPI0012FE09D4|nr:hypothetical protein [Thiomicrospira microaerophila]